MCSSHELYCKLFYCAVVHEAKMANGGNSSILAFSIRRKENYSYGKLRTIIEKKLLRDGKGEILIFKILEIYQWVFCALNLPRRHFLNVLRRSFVPIWRCLGNTGSSTATRLFSEDDRNCFDSRYAKPRPKSLLVIPYAKHLSKANW